MANKQPKFRDELSEVELAEELRRVSQSFELLPVSDSSAKTQPFIVIRANDVLVELPDSLKRTSSDIRQ